MNSSSLPADVANVRVQRPERHQVQWRDASLDQMIPADHRVRDVWAYVDALDLKPLYAKIQAVAGGAGRDAVDPKILLALWMWSTIEGVSSARHLDRLCKRDLAYIWLCGNAIKKRPSKCNASPRRAVPKKNLTPATPAAVRRCDAQRPNANNAWPRPCKN
jgi:transposase